MELVAGVDLNHRPLGYEIGHLRIHARSPVFIDEQKAG